MRVPADRPPMRTPLLPHRPPVEEPERDARVVTLGSGAAADVCRHLQSETATATLARVGRSPAPASDVADDLDVSLQTIDYHLGRLVDAGLVDAVGTWLSSRGTEMSVYAPAHRRVVIETAPATGSPAADGPATATWPGD
jgi:DNA-binding transcriptional ArsR family regulator